MSQEAAKSHVNIEFGDPEYGINAHVSSKHSFDDVVAATKAALATEGFGIITEIDMKATMKKKLGEDLSGFTVLGACNPTFAFKALQAEPGVALLVPCNVAVCENASGTFSVSAINPHAMFGVLKNDAVKPLADEVEGRLTRVMAAVTKLDSK